MASRALPEHFEAGAFHPDYGTRRAAGMLHIAPDGVQFQGENGMFQLPLEGLDVSVGGASDRLVFFAHPNFPKVSIFTSDQAVLDHPAFVHNRALGRARDRIRRRKLVARCVTFGILAPIFAAFAGVWLAKDPMVNALAARVPAEWEQKLGETAFSQVSLGKKLITDEDVKRQLDRLAQPLLAVVPADRYQFKLHIVEDPSLNAFALPGGNVTLHTGLLLAADSPEEILGVMAHEISHVTKQHGTRGIIESLGLYGIVSFLFGDVSGLAAILVNNVPFLLSQKFSRDHESEADEQGFRYMEAAKLNPRGLITFFEKMRREEEKLKEKLPGGEALDALSFLSTHPATPERMARLEKLLAKSPRKDAFAKVDLDFKEFQNALRAKLSQSDKAKKPEKLEPKKEKQ